MDSRIIGVNVSFYPDAGIEAKETEATDGTMVRWLEICEVAFFVHDATMCQRIADAALKLKSMFEPFSEESAWRVIGRASR